MKKIIIGVGWLAFGVLAWMGSNEETSGAVFLIAALMILGGAAVAVDGVKQFIDES